MDDQITVRLPASLGRTLRRTSRRLGRRPSDVVRMALDAFLQEAPSVDSKRAARVEDLIGSLSSGIPDLAAEWPEWDAHSRFSFAIDWPICEDTLGRLLDRDERGVLGPAQRARLASLKALIAQHRPTLERLLAES